MVQTCFRHQHPEAYEGLEVAEPSVPAELRYGRGDSVTHTGAGDVAEYVVEEGEVRTRQGLPSDAVDLLRERQPDTAALPPEV